MLILKHVNNQIFVALWSVLFLFNVCTILGDTSADSWLLFAREAKKVIHKCLKNVWRHQIDLLFISFEFEKKIDFFVLDFKVILASHSKLHKCCPNFVDIFFFEFRWNIFIFRIFRTHSVSHGHVCSTTVWMFSMIWPQ